MRSLIIFCIIGLFIISCARVGTPSGGAKDELPPVIVSAQPDFESTHFKSRKIKIHFDEYIKLKDLNKHLIISPPQKHKPDITPLGIASKTIVIKLKDTLQPNTTYTFNFGNAVVDNAEGNILQQFRYVFSTGDYVDSLSINGDVVNLMSDELPKNTLVMLYSLDSTYNDSTVYLQKPDYIGNTLDNTIFSINNIKQGRYKLLALKDANNNMVYDPRSDEIGFLTDTIFTPTDSTYRLSLFKEQLPFRVKRLSEHSKNRLWVPYEGDWSGTITRVYDSDNKDIPFVSYHSQSYDSIDVWYKDVSKDSLFVQIQTEKDSVFGMRLRKKSQDSLTIKSAISGTLHPNDSLFLKSNTPIIGVNPDLIQMMDKDSVTVSCNTIVDNNQPLKVLLDFEREPENNYHVSILPGAFQDFFDRTNDSIRFSVKTKKTTNYGEIILTVNTEKPVIVELLTDDNKLITTRKINQTGDLKFSQLIPDKYKFKVIIDSNNNGRWDTGNYLEHRQPETVIYPGININLRANWTTNESINID
ncbi:MAG: hypothetical protein CR968_01455 [Flavobacteriia bacterium]|nr:MAG: hypothetical protein CR968_01455 [Flavobacteriia bacterium]